MNYEEISLGVMAVSALWDLGRRFIARGATVDPEAFDGVSKEVAAFRARAAELDLVKEQLVGLRDVQTKLDTHEKALATHADAIVAHTKEIAGAQRSLTAVGLAKAVR